MGRLPPFSGTVVACAAFTYTRPVTVAEAFTAGRLRLQGVRSAHVRAGAYRLHYLEAAPDARSSWCTASAATRL